MSPARRSDPPARLCCRVWRGLGWSAKQLDQRVADCSGLILVEADHTAASNLRVEGDLPADLGDAQVAKPRRLEVLPEYDVTSDDDDFRRWLDGASEPTWCRKQPWLDTLRHECENGQISRRVRLLSERLTDYERYACDFGYRYNGDYEDIRVLHRGEHEIPGGLIERDFWIISDSVGVRMHYSERGCFSGADVVDSPELADYLCTWNAAWTAGEAFAQWWGRHPEFHRKAVA